MEKSILRNQIKKIKPQSSGRFHMPGHKGKIVDFCFADLDITEIPGADNLHDAHGIIDRVHKKMADIFGSKDAAILINGSTTGIQSAILSACQPGEELLVPLHCHRSVFGALALGRIKGRFISPELEAKWGFAKTVSPESVKKALRSYPKIKGMVLVNPTYYGTVSDIQTIAQLLHEQGKFLIVDEAHGAQFYFSSVFPKTALEAGADLVIQSTHKVLGSLTQSALMHGQGDLIDWNRVKLFLALLQSSSPSYPLMISVEEAIDRSLERGNLVFEKIKESHIRFCNNQTGREMIQLYDGQKDPLGYDYSKWLFLSQGIKGTTVEKMLRDRYQIQCEMSDCQTVLAMAGLETTQSDLNALIAAIEALNQELGECPKRKKTEALETFEIKLEVPIWEALWSDKKEKIRLSSALNRIVADFIIPYPPGIPLLLPGSRVSDKQLKKLQRMIEDGVAVVGIDIKKKLLVMEEAHERK